MTGKDLTLDLYLSFRDAMELLGEPTENDARIDALFDSMEEYRSETRGDAIADIDAGVDDVFDRVNIDRDSLDCDADE